jgi:hypothetical protein
MKSPHFQIIHYVPDLFLGGGIPVAAVLVDAFRGQRLVRASFHPDPRCLGGTEHAIALDLLMRRLEKSLAQFLSREALGPHIRIEEPRPIPADVNPERWLLDHVLPRPPSAKGVRGRRRSTYGFSWLEAHGLGDFVHKQFRVEKFGHAGLLGLSEGLKPISHWTAGGNQLLLMEPIALDVPEQSLRNVMEEVATLFSAYRYAAGKHAPGFDLQLAAYILEGGDAIQRKNVAKNLGTAAHQVFDLERDHDVTSFISQVARIGGAARLLD